MSKVCSKCGVEKPLESFYRKAKSRDGRKSSCKDCDRAYFQTPAGRLAHLTASRKYAKTEKGRVASRKSCTNFRKTESFKNSIQKYRANYPERRAAQTALYNAIQTGKVVRPASCSVCAAECTPEGHHFDYSKPLDVIWVCKTCHTDYHWSKS